MKAIITGLKFILFFIIMGYLCFTPTGLGVLALKDNWQLMIVVYLPMFFILPQINKLEKLLPNP